MSDALEASLKDKTFEEAHGHGYITVDENVVIGCAIGGVASQLIPKSILNKYYKKTVDECWDSKFEIRVELVKKICRKIKGSCDQVPQAIWDKECEYTDYSEMSETEYMDEKEATRWIDFIETLFESKEKTFKQIIKILRKYDK